MGTDKGMAQHLVFMDHLFEFCALLGSMGSLITYEIESIPSEFLQPILFPRARKPGNHIQG